MHKKQNLIWSLSGLFLGIFIFSGFFDKVFILEAFAQISPTGVSPTGATPTGVQSAPFNPNVVLPAGASPTGVQPSSIVPKGVTSGSVAPTEVKPTLINKLTSGWLESIRSLFQTAFRKLGSLLGLSKSVPIEQQQKQDLGNLRGKFGTKPAKDIIKDQLLLNEIKSYVSKYHPVDKFSNPEELIRIFEQDEKSFISSSVSVGAGAGAVTPTGKEQPVTKPATAQVSGTESGVELDGGDSGSGATSGTGDASGGHAAISCDVEGLDKLYSQQMKQAAAGRPLSDYFAERLESIATSILTPVLQAELSGNWEAIRAAKDKAIPEFKKRIFTVGGKSETQYCFASNCKQCQELKGQCLQVKFESPSSQLKNLGKNVNINILFRIKDYNGQKYTLSALSYLSGGFTPANRILKEGSTVKSSGGVFSGNLKFCAKLGGVSDKIDFPFTVSQEIQIIDKDLDEIVEMLR